VTLYSSSYSSSHASPVNRTVTSDPMQSTVPARAAKVSTKRAQAGHFARRLERACVVSLLLSMMSQLNAQVALPTYNSMLAGWGLFSAYSRSGPAVFGLLGFLSLSFLLDVVFLSLWSSGEADILSRDDESTGTATTSFSVVMMSFNLAVKCAVVYYGAHLYAVLSPAKVQRPRAPDAGPISPSSSVRRSVAGSRSGAYALPSSPPPRPPSITPSRDGSSARGSDRSNCAHDGCEGGGGGPGSPAAKDGPGDLRPAMAVPALNLAPKRLPGDGGDEGKTGVAAEGKSDGAQVGT